MSRVTAMRIIAWLLAGSGVAFGLSTIVFGIVGPEQEIHAVHNAVVAALLIVLTAPAMLAVARAPERPIRPLVVLAVLSLAGAVAMVVGLTADPFTLPVLVLIGVLWWLAPTRADAWPAGRPSLPMLALVLAGAVLLVPYAIENAGLQRTDQASDHAAFFHWVETAFYALGAVLLGLLGALRPAAFRTATRSAGVALVILGAASAAFAGYPSALPGPWSWVVLIGGAALVVIGEWEARRATRGL